MRKVAKRRKRDKFQDLADEQLALPSLDYFVGMHKLATYAKPHIEKLLLRQRAEAVDTTKQHLISGANMMKPSLRGQSR